VIIPHARIGILKKDMQLNLPKGYLSHTQIDMWIKDKKQYRRMYYEGRQMYQTPEIEFGRSVARQYEMLHTEENWPVDHPVIRRIPRGTRPEFEVRAEIESIPLLGFIDSYDENSGIIHELKTGKTPWTQARVDKHGQLKIYSLLLKKMFGKHNPYVQLHWLPTATTKKKDIIDGIGFTSNEITLTGDVETFHTTISITDLFDYTRLIKQVYSEIVEDYGLWKRLHPSKDQPQ